MILLLALMLWILLLGGALAVCRCGHLEDVARGFTEDEAPLRARMPAG